MIETRLMDFRKRRMKRQAGELENVPLSWAGMNLDARRQQGRRRFGVFPVIVEILLCGFPVRHHRDLVVGAWKRNGRLRKPAVLTVAIGSLGVFE